MLAATRLSRLATATSGRSRLCCGASKYCASMAAPGWPSPAAPPRRQVVTAFVQRPVDGAVLVVLRSDKVGTYQHKWGAVSGGIEGAGEDPVFRAQQEILEEVGLQPSQVALVRSGRPLAVDDGHLHFCIHPFLFRLLPEHAGAEVVLNWENKQAAWVAPALITGLDAVPLLAETYGRLHLPPTQAAAVQRLADDRQSGAAQLAAQAVVELDREAEAAAAICSSTSSGSGSRDGSEDGGVAALDALRTFGYHLAAARPSMAAVANSVAALLAAAHEELHSRADAFGVPLGEVTAIVRAAAAAEQQRLAAAAASVRDQAAALLLEASNALQSEEGLGVMTLSISSSVLEALKASAAQGCKLRVFVCEARPLCEGVLLAEALAAAGIECTLITDAQAALFLRECQLALVGADAVTPKVAVNKVGTHLLALAARQAGVPLYVVAGSGKLSPGPVEALAHPGLRAVQQHEEKAAGEVTAAWGRPTPPGVAVRNVYFEPTPLELATALVTESGRLDAGAIAAAVQARRRLYHTAFQLC